MPNFSVFILLFFASFCMVYAIGHLLLAFFNQSHSRLSEKLFQKLALGTFFPVIIYAVCRTGGMSFATGIVPLLVFLAWKSNFKTKHFKENIGIVEWKSIAWLSLAAVALFIIQWNQMADNAIHPDYSFYAGVGAYIDKTGIESVGMDWINTELVSAHNYHFGEIWLAVILSKILGLGILNSFVFIALPLLSVVFYAGMTAFIQKQFHFTNWKAYLLTGILPCLVVFQYLILNDFSFLGYEIQCLGSLYIQKFLPICIVFTAVLLTDDWIKKVLFLCMGVLLFTTIMPAVACGLGIWFCIRLIRRQFSSNLWLGMLILSFTVAFLFLFPLIGAVKHPILQASSSETASIFLIIQKSMSASNGMGLILVNIAKRTIDILLNVAPYLLLLFVFTKEQRAGLRNLLKKNSVFGFIILAGIFIHACTWVLVDSIQLLTAVSFPLLLISFFVAIIYSIKKLKGWKLIFPIILIVSNLFMIKSNTRANKLDIGFYKAIEKKIKLDGNFAFIQSGQSLMSTNQFFRNANYVYVFPDMRRFTDNYLPVNLSVYDIPYDPDDFADATYVIPSIENSPFYRYVEKNSLQKDLNKAQNQFIKEKNIRYIIVQKGMKNWFEDRPFTVEKVFYSYQEDFDLYVINYVGNKSGSTLE